MDFLYPQDKPFQMSFNHISWKGPIKPLNFPKKPFFSTLELQLFFLLPFGFDLFILMCSTVSYFLELSSSQAQVTGEKSSASTLTNILSVFSNGQQVSTNTKDSLAQRWYMGHRRHIVHLVYLLFLGFSFASYFKFFKCKKATEDQKRAYREYFPEFKLWFLISIVHSGFNVLFDLVPKKSATGAYEVTKLLLILGQVFHFVAIFLYIKQSWRTLMFQFWTIFRDKEGNFESAKFRFFFSRILYILLVDIVLSAGAVKLVELLPFHKTIGDNQAQVEKGLSHSQPWGFWIWSAFSTLIIAPISEELLYRRVLLKPSHFHWSFIITSAFIFGIIHVTTERETIFRILPYSIGGAIFAWTYCKYRNIWMSIFVHGFHNLISLLLFFIKGGV